MKLQKKNAVCIDGSNLYNGMITLGWKLDYRRFRVWLKEKYEVETAYLFLGMIPKYNNLYINLENQGYTLIFKEVTYDRDGKPKGNYDADLVVKVMQDAYENKFDQAVLVSSDGDYTGLVRFLQEKSRLSVILSPAKEDRCSVLLKRTSAPIVYIKDKKHILT